MPRRPHDDTSATAGSEDSVDGRTLCERASEDGSYDGRPSGELLDGDGDILESEDERERMLTQKEGFTAFTGLFKGSRVTVGKRVAREMRERKGGQEDESRALMYEMGDGIGASNFDLRGSESDGQRLLAAPRQSKACSI